MKAYGHFKIVLGRCSVLPYSPIAIYRCHICKQIGKIEIQNKLLTVVGIVYFGGHFFDSLKWHKNGIIN